MHIPDGFLTAPTAATCGVLALGGVAVALRTTTRVLPDRKVPLLGCAAAFVFATQMLNFPVAAGTSGHLIGGVLCAVLLGPAAAVVAMTTVLILQCLLFADGGVTALGANILNMALAAPIVGYGLYRGLLHLLGTGIGGHMTAAGFAAWASTVTAALLCAGELASSGIVAWHLVFPAMGFIHVLIGLGEAVITAMVLGAIGRARPHLLLAPPPATEATREWGTAGVGVIVAIGLVLFVSPFACAWPDGLEKVANDLGFEHRGAADPVFSSPIPDYAIPGMTSSFWATALAGLTGLLATFTLLVLFGLGMTRCRQHEIALAPVTPAQAPRAE